MLIHSIVCAFACMFCSPNSHPFEKMVHSESGEHLVTLTNTWWWNSRGHKVVITVGPRAEILVREYGGHAVGSRESGPYIWGCADAAIYTCGYIANILGGNYDIVRVSGGPVAIDDLVAMEEARQTGTDEQRKIIWNRILGFGQRYGFEVHPLNEYIHDRASQEAINRGEGTLADNWNLSFDAIYLSLEEVTVAAAHEGDLLVWELDRTQDPGNNDWTTREPVATTIDSHFRILRAAEQLYLVDTEGAIYTDLDQDHKQIGTVGGWEGESPVILLEDQHREKIVFLRISAAGEITVLGIDWSDQSFAADFLTEVTSPELRAAIIRMAEIMREDAGSGE